MICSQLRCAARRKGNSNFRGPSCGGRVPFCSCSRQRRIQRLSLRSGGALRPSLVRLSPSLRSRALVMRHQFAPWGSDVLYRMTRPKSITICAPCPSRIVWSNCQSTCRKPCLSITASSLLNSLQYGARAWGAERLSESGGQYDSARVLSSHGAPMTSLKMKARRSDGPSCQHDPSTRGASCSAAANFCNLTSFLKSWCFGICMKALRAATAPSAVRTRLTEPLTPEPSWRTTS
mmetsp:Transcript_16248/g.52091  ORF Transcript_16248/g.52091 Transcript_16248/m.52091 type:complete len:234 (+) Transcript_16248:222-923(+)